jgi:hypothetical protein
MEKKKFDYEAFKKEAAERLKKGGSVLGRDGVFTPLFKEFLEEALEGELEAHIEEDPEPNRKNGKGKKTVKTPNGAVEIETPRDRNGTFEPELIAMNTRTPRSKPPISTNSCPTPGNRGKCNPFRCLIKYVINRRDSLLRGRYFVVF